MSDMDFLERQALERAAYINRNTFNANENSTNAGGRSGRGEKIRQKVTSLPVEFPEGYSYPNFKTAFNQEKERPIKKTGINSFEQKRNLSELLHDPEAALLTGLIMLLQSEGADEILLAALGYILL